MSRPPCSDRSPPYFGSQSVDRSPPNKITAFALSDVGETVYLSSAVNDQLTDYQSKEDFGPSTEGETLGAYYKPSTDSYNFVAMKTPTPGAVNSGPRVGPIVISEIMYNPAGSGTGDAEYLELLNVSSAPVTLYDSVKGKAWRISDGIDFEFPAVTPLTMAPGERVVITKNLTLFNTVFGASVPAGTKVFEWITGGLSNGGETLQLDRPGGVDALNILQYVRVERVNYEDAAPWPTAADGGGPSLTKIAEKEYGNDFVNWVALTASPGAIASGPRFGTWATGAGLVGANALPGADPDSDSLSNLLEYALGTNPAAPNLALAPAISFQNGQTVLQFEVDPARPDVDYSVEFSMTLQSGSWQPLESTPLYLSAGKQLRQAVHPLFGMPRCFYRLKATLKP